MQIVSIDDVSISEISRRLLDGEVIVYPTETCYGIGCDATNQVAVDRIFEIKKRQKNKPLLVIMPDLDMVFSYIDWSPTIQNIADTYWPGALTCVCPIKSDVDPVSGIKAKDNTLAFRVTSYPFVHELSKKMQRPLVSTSANISQMQSCYDLEAIKKMFTDTDNQPDLVIDAGTLPERTPSTIIKILGKEMYIIRQGEVVVDGAILQK